MEFKEILKNKIDYVEKLLMEYMPKEEGYQKTIMQAMNYSLSAGGKRLRPILLSLIHIYFQSHQQL